MQGPTTAEAAQLVLGMAQRPSQRTQQRTMYHQTISSLQVHSCV